MSIKDRSTQRDKGERMEDIGNAGVKTLEWQRGKLGGGVSKMEGHGV